MLRPSALHAGAGPLSCWSVCRLCAPSVSRFACPPALATTHRCDGVNAVRVRKWLSVTWNASSCVLDRLLVGRVVRCDESDLLAVRAPAISVDAVFRLGESERFAAIHWQNEDLALLLVGLIVVVALGYVARLVAGITFVGCRFILRDKGEPRSIGRPSRHRQVCAVVSERAARTGRDIHKVELLLVLVALPIWRGNDY